MNKKYFLTGFIVLAISCMLVQAQPQQFGFDVNGKVYDATAKSPLEYVSVVVYNSTDSSLVSGTITQADGSFSIRVKRPGRYYVTADFMGYGKEYFDNVNLKPGTSKLNIGIIELKPIEVGIEEVEVVAEKPFMSYQLDRKVVDVSRNPSAQGGTAVDALENIPSIETDMEGNVLLRGNSSFTVLIDGRQSPLTGSDALHQIPSSAIDKIEIITNPSVKYDPDGTAGIINILTKKGKLKGHSFVLNGSAGNSPMVGGDMSYSYRKGKLTFTGGINYRNQKMDFFNYSDQIISSYDSTGFLDSPINIIRDMTGKMNRKGASVKGGVDFQLTPANLLSVGGSYNVYGFSRYFDSEINNYAGTDYSVFNVSNSGFEVNPDNWQITLGDKHVFKENIKHFLTVDFTYQQKTDTEEESVELYNTDQYWSNASLIGTINSVEIDEDGRRVRAEIDYQHPFSENLMLETGYTFRYDEENKDYGRFFKNNPEDLFIRDSEFDDRSEFRRSIHAGWALMKGQAFGLQFSGGVRLENTDRKIEALISDTAYTYNNFDWYPSISIAKEWEGDHHLQASYSKRINRPRDHQLNPFPRLTDGYIQFVPNPSLQPEYIQSVELNYQKSWGMNYVALETFYHNSNNEMEKVILSSADTLEVYTIINLDQEKRIGAEFSANYKITKWWTVFPTASYYYFEISGKYNGENSQRSSYNWNANLTNNFNITKKTRFQITTIYRSPSARIDGDREATYWISGAIRQDLLDRKMTITLRADDIFATRINKSTNFSDNSISYNEQYRKSPMFYLSISYRFNQNGDKRGKNGRSDNGNGAPDDGGGMDMDF